MRIHFKYREQLAADGTARLPLCEITDGQGNRLDLVQSVRFTLRATDMVPVLTLEVIPEVVEIEGEAREITQPSPPGPVAVTPVTGLSVDMSPWLTRGRIVEVSGGPRVRIFEPCSDAGTYFNVVTFDDPPVAQIISRGAITGIVLQPDELASGRPGGTTAAQFPKPLSEGVPAAFREAIRRAYAHLVSQEKYLADERLAMDHNTVAREHITAACAALGCPDPGVNYR